MSTVNQVQGQKRECHLNCTTEIISWLEWPNRHTVVALLSWDSLFCLKKAFSHMILLSLFLLVLLSFLKKIQSTTFL